MLKLIGFVTLLALVLIGAGWLLGWVQFANAEAGDRSQVSISVDGDAVERDVAKLRDRADEVWDDIRDADAEELDEHFAPADTVAQGRLESIEGNELRLTISDSVETIELTEPTAFLRNGETAERNDLVAGDWVVVAKLETEDEILTLVRASNTE